jgi:H+/gluconate symporter-like permease
LIKLIPPFDNRHPASFMTGFILIAIFVVFAVLMFTRRVPALLAVPAMAILAAIVVGLPFNGILNDVISAGVIRLAPAYVAVFAGAMLGRVMMTTGIAEAIIKRAAEFGGDRPLVVAFALMIATAILFTTLTGLGAIIMVGSLVLPIMMSLGLNRKLVAVLFLLAFATGFIFNIALIKLYREFLQIAPDAPLPTDIVYFAFGLLGIMSAAVVIYAVISERRFGEVALFAVKSKDELVGEIPAEKNVPFFSFLTPLVPLVLYFFFGWKEVPAFLGGALFGLLTTQPRRAIQNFTSSLVRGLEDGAPAAILMMGIGMLLVALKTARRRSRAETDCHCAADQFVVELRFVFRIALAARALSRTAECFRRRHRRLQLDVHARHFAAARAARRRDVGHAGAERLRPDEHAQRLDRQLHGRARRGNDKANLAADDDRLRRRLDFGRDFVFALSKMANLL